MRQDHRPLPYLFVLLCLAVVMPSNAFALDPGEARRAIGEKYASLGEWERLSLGWETSDVKQCKVLDCAFQQFEGGRIVYDAHHGAHYVVGDIYSVWSAGMSGGHEYDTGVPVTDELVCPDERGRYNHFEWKHSIYWTPEYGAFEVSGYIRDAWENQGWENGPAGYPTSTLIANDGRCGGKRVRGVYPGTYQEFEGGFFCDIGVQKPIWFTHW